MKKKISLLLACGMLAAALPQQAMAKPYETYPFIYEDFEDKRTDLLGWSNASYKISDDGYGRSAASLAVTMSEDGQGVSFPITLTKGTTYNISCNVKPEGEIMTDKLDFVFWMYSLNADGTVSRNQVYARAESSGHSLAAGKWTRATAKYTYEGYAADGKTAVSDTVRMQPRIGNGQLGQINGGSGFTFLLDDVSVEPVLEKSTVPDSDGDDNGGLIAGGSFEGRKINEKWESDNVSAVLVKDGADGTGGCVRVSGEGTFGQHVPLTYSHTYKISGYLKGTEDSVGTPAAVNIIRGQDTESYPVCTLGEDWTRFEIEYFNPLVTNDTQNPLLCISTGGADYMLDEISLTSEKGILHNGDFSAELGKYWLTENADAVISDDAPEGILNALHITQTKRRGKAYQNIAITPGEKYTLSFWAKGLLDGIDAIKLVPTLDDGNTKQMVKTDDDLLKFSTEWQSYSVEFTADAGLAACPIFYIAPSNELRMREYLLADIRLSAVGADDGSSGEATDYTTPEVRNITADGYLINGSTIEINAEYLGKNKQTGLVQVLKKAEDGGWASVKSAEFSGADVSYSFAARDIGQDIKVRIVPMDSEGAVGGYRELELGRVSDIYEIEQSFTSGLGDTVSASATVENNSGAARDVVCMLLLYDAQNTCVMQSVQSVRIEFGESKNVDISAENPGSAESARLFIWEGRSAADTSMLPLVRSIELTK